MNRCTVVIMLVLLLSTLCNQGAAQDEIRKYHFDKGEAMDILLLNQNPQSDSIVKVYFETAIPIAIKNGYQPRKGFSTEGYALQGNYQPGAMVIASWPSEKVRQTCLSELEEQVDGFHRMRRQIWTNFNVTYYPLNEDLDFTIDMNRYNVATAYWGADIGDMGGFITAWEGLTAKRKGQVIVNLSGGKAPLGYRYNPTYFIISSWDSAEHFKDFQEEQIQMDHNTVEQVHQFRIH